MACRRPGLEQFGRASVISDCFLNCDDVRQAINPYVLREQVMVSGVRLESEDPATLAAEGRRKKREITPMSAYIDNYVAGAEHGRNNCSCARLILA
jgi:hypothetical protein